MFHIHSIFVITVQGTFQDESINRQTNESESNSSSLISYLSSIELKMQRDVRFLQRSLLDGLLEIFSSSPLLSLGTFLLILFISSIIPLSFLWLILCFAIDSSSLLPALSPWLRGFLTFWSIVEVIFFIYQTYLYAVAQRRIDPPHLTSVERQRLALQALSNIKDIRLTLSKWFLERPIESIDRRSILNWLSFAFFSKNFNELDDIEFNDLHSLLTRIESDHQLSLNDLKLDHKVSHMQHILDPVPVIFRPFVFYLVTDTLLNDVLSRILFYLKGYEHVEIGHLQFWTFSKNQIEKNQSEEKDEEEAIIFFHGIGAGLLMYQPFISRVHQQFSPTRRIIWISMRCICMRYPSLKEIPNMKETVDSIQKIFDHYKLKKATFIGHRFLKTLSLHKIIDFYFFYSAMELLVFRGLFKSLHN